MAQSRPGIALESGWIASFSRIHLIVLAVILLCLCAPQYALAQFVDTFSRPDGADVGNGWIEKSPQAFQIAAGEVAKTTAGGGYRGTATLSCTGLPLRTCWMSKPRLSSG